MFDKKRILIVEDEEKILMVVKLYLEKAGFEVTISMNGKEAISLFKKEPFSLVLLDLMLPDLSGEEICKQIRLISRVPIIMLTAKSKEESIITGLNIGADDYIIKPFSLKQLLARITAVLRRSEKATSPLSNRLSFNNDELVIDNTKYEVYKNSEKIVLTPIEFKLISLFASSPQRVFTRDEIIDDIYQNDFGGFDRAIDTHIKNLRKKLGDQPPKYILTVHGVGYRFGGE